MIISKDLFIFGEQIFATIIPEVGSSQGSQQQQQQQQQHQQQQHHNHHNHQPVLVNAATTLKTGAPTTGTSTAPTVGPISAAGTATQAGGGAEQAQVEPLKAAVAAVAAAASKTNNLSQQETVAVVVVATAAAAAAAAAAANVNGCGDIVAAAKKGKIQKIPKETEELLLPRAKNKRKEKPQLPHTQPQTQSQCQHHKPNQLPSQQQQQQQQHQQKSALDNKKGANFYAKKTAESERRIVETVQRPPPPDLLRPAQPQAEVVLCAQLAEREPLVQRQTSRIVAAMIGASISATLPPSPQLPVPLLPPPPPPPTTTIKSLFAPTTPLPPSQAQALSPSLGPRAAPAATTLPPASLSTHPTQEQQQRSEEAAPLLQHQLQLQQQQQQRTHDCRLEIEATTVSAETATTTTSLDSSADSHCEEGKTPNMGKVVLGSTSTSTNNNNTTSTSTTSSSTRPDHAMIAIPFISEQLRTLQLTFQNINVLHNERKILSDVSGLVSPGEVLAIMGPSGSGKTTLLDCLSGQRRIDSGGIYLNREPVSKKWRRKICYVLQEEVFFSGLTLRETVMYTALLRLPEKMPKAEKIKLVDRILDALELNFCQQTKFGDYLNRGLSGGEKKRANIACELLTNPLLMLLDEPTSGLDSHSAISLMKVLKRYALQEQKTVVITVHQPSSQMFHMFDKLLLLYNGRTAYFGEVNNIYRYFEDIGVAIKPHYNPADFVLEQLKSYPDIREKLFVAAKESHSNFLNRNCITLGANNHHNTHHIHNHNHNHNHHHHRHHHNVDDAGGGITVTSTNGTEPVLLGEKSHKHDVLINDIIHNYYNQHSQQLSHEAMLLMGGSGDGSGTGGADNHHHVEEATQQLVWCGADSQSNFSSASSDFQQYESAGGDWLDYPTRFHTQFSVLSSRNFKEAKPRMLSKLNWFQTIGLALMAGAIWFQIPRTEEFLHDLQGWMFFSQTYWMLFALFGALNSFPSEREVISKERRSGAYRLSAYYLAKMFGELPLVVTLPTVYLIISYPMLGCSSFKLFFLMLVFLLLNTIVAQSVGFFIGACCMDMNVSITLSALYTLATQLFGGYLSSRIPEGLSWIRYTSMIHYAYQNMQILEFREGPTIRCGDPSSYEICKNNATTLIPYQEILKAQNSTSPLWLNTLILMMFFLVFRGLGYAVLRYVRCPKT